jgi:hypothetical protein
VHHIGDMRQRRTELAARMEGVEIARGKSLGFEQGNRKRIAKRNCMSVEVVGASPCGQASCSRGSSSTMSASRPSAEPRPP